MSGVGVTWLVDGGDCCACPDPQTSKAGRTIKGDYSNGEYTAKNTFINDVTTSRCPCGETTWVDNQVKIESNYSTAHSYEAIQTYTVKVTQTDGNGDTYTEQSQSQRTKRLYSSELSESYKDERTETSYSVSKTVGGVKFGYRTTTESARMEYNPDRTITVEPETTSCPRYTTTLNEDGKDTTRLLTDSENESVITWSKCVETSLEPDYEEVMVTYATDYGSVVGCPKTMVLAGNTNKSNSCLSVYVNPLLKDSQSGLLRDLLSFHSLAKGEVSESIIEPPPVGFLDEGEFIGGGYEIQADIFTNSNFLGGTEGYGFYNFETLMQSIKTFAEFTQTTDDYYSDQDDTTKTISRVIHDTSGITEGYFHDREEGLKDTTLHHTKLSQLTMESIDTHRTQTFNNETVELKDADGNVTEIRTRRGTGSFARIDHWGFEAQSLDTTLDVSGLKHQLFNMADSAEDAEGKNTMISTVLGARFASEGGNDSTRIALTQGVKGTVTYRTENASVIGDTVDTNYVIVNNGTTLHDGSPFNCYNQFGYVLTEKPWDNHKLANGSPRFHLYQASTLAYPAYQDIYDVGTGGMLYGRLNSEFSSTLLGAQSASANSALVRLSAVSATVMKPVGENEVKTTLIALGDPKNKLMYTDSDLEQSIINKQIEYQTGITHVYFTQKSYTATSWASVSTTSDTVETTGVRDITETQEEDLNDDGINETFTVTLRTEEMDTTGTFYNIARQSGETYSGENYEREDGGAPIHSFFVDGYGVDEYGVGALGGVLQNGSPRTITFQVIDYGIPFALRTTEYGNKCAFTSGTTILKNGTHQFVGTGITMFATDQVWNVGALRDVMNGGTTMDESDYYKYKPIKLE